MMKFLKMQKELKLLNLIQHRAVWWRYTILIDQN